MGGRWGGGGGGVWERVESAVNGWDGRETMGRARNLWEFVGRGGKGHERRGGK